MVLKRARSRSPPSVKKEDLSPSLPSSSSSSSTQHGGNLGTVSTTALGSDREGDASAPRHVAKKLKPSPQPDRLSALSDELLIRILHLLPVECVLVCQSVSRRFRGLAGDAQVWKGLYWGRWVRPRVRMLPRTDDEKGGRELLAGFSGRGSRWLDEGRLLTVGAEGREGNVGSGGGGEGKLKETETATGNGNEKMKEGKGRVKGPKTTDWKGRYKLRHNWSIGAAEMGEIELGLGLDPTQDAEDLMGEDFERDGKTLMAKLVDRVVVTVDIREGLRAWDLKRRECVAQSVLTNDHGDNGLSERMPTCLGVDSGSEELQDAAVVVGFQDGAFEIWALELSGNGEKGIFEKRYRSPAVGKDEVDVGQDVQLSAVAYAQPYLLTITADHVLSLYVFSGEITAVPGHVETPEAPSDTGEIQNSTITQRSSRRDSGQRLFNSKTTTPRLLTSLKSYTCWPPLSLSIRSTPHSIIASIAYALPNYLRGWSVGLQELHLTRLGTILRSRLASAVEPGFHSLISSSAPSTPPLSHTLRPSTPEVNETAGRSSTRHGRGTHPTTLSYSHPYLLAGNRDNTLSLYLVTSNNEELKISKSTTLWGHTSSVSGAHVGGRGKAVSVSARGDELRVWELEAGLGRKVVQERSVLVRREQSRGDYNEDGGVADREPWRRSYHKGNNCNGQRRGWVGFNDEVVIVLKEESEGGQTLVVYDFT